MYRLRMLKISIIPRYRAYNEKRKHESDQAWEIEKTKKKKEDKTMKQFNGGKKGRRVFVLDRFYGR